MFHSGNIVSRIAADEMGSKGGSVRVIFLRNPVRKKEELCRSEIEFENCG